MSTNDINYHQVTCLLSKILFEQPSLVTVVVIVFYVGNLSSSISQQHNRELSFSPTLLFKRTSIVFDPRGNKWFTNL